MSEVEAKEAAKAAEAKAAAKAAAAKAAEDARDNVLLEGAENIDELIILANNWNVIFEENDDDEHYKKANRELLLVFIDKMQDLIQVDCDKLKGIVSEKISGDSWWVNFFCRYILLLPKQNQLRTCLDAALFETPAMILILISKSMASAFTKYYNFDNFYISNDKKEFKQ